MVRYQKTSKNMYTLTPTGAQAIAMRHVAPAPMTQSFSSNHVISLTSDRT